MGIKEKLMERLFRQPKDFTYAELKTLMNSLGFVEYNKGKTSGSRVRFLNEKNGRFLILHKPHPGNTLKGYQIKEIVEFIKQEGY